MFNNLRRNWWPTLVVVQAVLTAATVILTMIVAPDQQGSEVVGFRVVVGTIGLVSTVLLVAGLTVLDRNRQAGSWMIAMGSVPTLLTLVALNPVALLAAATIVGGLWTGNLAFTSRPAEIDSDQPVMKPTSPAGARWYWWIITAIALFTLGLSVLMLFDGVDMSEQAEGLLYFTWLLSWAAAAATGTIGVALGAMRLATRHRTRTA